MARSARVVRRGPGYFGLIFFLVLSLVLMGGVAWFWFQFSKFSQSLETLQADIEENLEKPLEEPLGVSAQDTASPADIAYPPLFFQTIAEKALKGKEYDELRPLAGWEDAKDAKDATAAKQIGVFLKKGEVKYTTLRKYIEALETQLSETKDHLDRIQSELVGFADKYRTAQAQLQQKDKQLDALRSATSAEAQNSRADYATNIERMKGVVAKANTTERQAQEKLAADTGKLKQTIARGDSKVDKLDATVRNLKKELEKKRPKKVAVKEARIIKANLVEGIAIINKGKIEQIEVGEKFTVMHVARGGKRTPKGELNVIRVNKYTSLAEIVKEAEEIPIMRGDVVWRQKQFAAPK